MFTLRKTVFLKIFSILVVSAFLFSCNHSPENKNAVPENDSSVNKIDSFSWTRMGRNDTMESCGGSFTENDSDLLHEKNFVCHTFTEYKFALVSVNGKIVKLHLASTNQVDGGFLTYQTIDEIYSGKEFTLAIHLHFTHGPDEDSDEVNYYSGTAILASKSKTIRLYITGYLGC